jgi:hypothetical protein
MDEVVSNFAFKLNLRRYMKASHADTGGSNAMGINILTGEIGDMVGRCRLTL